MIKEKIDGLGEFEFHETYFIGRIYEGVDAGNNFVPPLSKLIQKHFSGRPTIYISDRINSYSLDPIATNDLIAKNNISFSAIVTYNKKGERFYSYLNTVIEGAIICSFDSLDNAVTWAKLKALELN
jgi:hypothetical protein